MGGGFVGACSAAVTADSGHETLVFDIDADKVKKLSSNDRDLIESCIHEEGLADLLIRNRERISFTTDVDRMEQFVHDLDCIFMCLPTPEKPDSGEADLSYYEKAVAMLGPVLKQRNNGAQTKRIIIINKSTVPIHMIDATEALFTAQGVKNVGVVSNPEFLVEGKAIEGSVRPPRVVVGANHQEDFLLMRQLFQRFYDSANIAYIEVNPYEAAAAKLLANFLLFNKVVLTYDVIGRVCERFAGIRYEQVRSILMSDPRIGNWGLYDSLFAGGSCFIKDASSLAHQLEQAGAGASMVHAVLEANVFQRDHFFGRAETDAGFDWSKKSVAILGLAFKQDTNDIRNSGAIGIIQQVLGAGASSITIYDPSAMDEGKKYFDANKNPLYGRIRYAANETDALEGTQVCVICTDWPQFKTLGETIKKTVKAPYLIMDGRRMLQGQFAELQKMGYDILAVGSPFIQGA